jgi:RNA polymerase sigma factor (TIGR02999 family)
MAGEGQESVSGLIRAWIRGDQQALNSLMSIVYPELRRIARRHLHSSRNTLESAALANEAYLKLVHARGVRCESRAQFLACCAQIIRNIVVDYARHRQYAKRGGNLVRVPLEEEVVGARKRGVELVALNDALTSLSAIDPRKGRIVELRYFGGLTAEEAAEVLGISPETVLRDWKMAKAWLLDELSPKEPHPRRGE